MALKPGSISDFANSMAQAMDQAFHNQWQTAKGEPLPDAGEVDRQLLFAAIAQGVVHHLKQHANDAFQIDVQVTQTGDVVGADKLIVSQGTATRVEILSE